MILLLPTIQHTGSYFVAAHLLKGWKRLTLRDTQAQIDALAPGEDAVIFDHLFLHKMPLWKKLLPLYPAIVPLRDCQEVHDSWARRGWRDEGPLEELWSVLWSEVDKYNPYYLPIDSEFREEYLAELNEGLGLSLDAGDWPVINSKRTGAADQ